MEVLIIVIIVGHLMTPWLQCLANKQRSPS